jgi:outer membrane protein OmpA-like peptidoglycan-associated protein
MRAVLAAAAALCSLACPIAAMANEYPEAHALTQTPAASSWSARMDAALTGLRRAARGSGIAVQRDGRHIHLAVWDGDAFMPNTAQISAPLKALLDELSDLLDAPTTWRIEVVGHAMGGGAREANERLAAERGAVVQRQLKLRGFSVGAGKARASSSSRRGVELFLVNDEG